MWCRCFATLLSCWLTDWLPLIYVLGLAEAIGVGKTDARAEPIPLNEDARPIVMGLIWRKLVFKCTLTMDRPEVQ